MKIIRIKDVPEVPRSNEMFNGTVTLKALLGKNVGAKDISVTIVTFPPVVRTVFHAHTSDQALYVLTGKGIVADEKQEVVVTEGDIGFIPAGEMHWHGATEESSFSHMSILRPGQFILKDGRILETG